jgi:hypothetical protein
LEIPHLRRNSSWHPENWLPETVVPMQAGTFRVFAPYHVWLTWREELFRTIFRTINLRREGQFNGLWPILHVKPHGRPDEFDAKVLWSSDLCNYGSTYWWFVPLNASELLSFSFQEEKEDPLSFQRTSLTVQISLSKVQRSECFSSVLSIGNRQINNLLNGVCQEKSLAVREDIMFSIRPSVGLKHPSELDVFLSHFDWRQDCLKVGIAKSKWNYRDCSMYCHDLANSLAPWICPVLSLALHLECNLSSLVGDGKHLFHEFRC